MSLRLYFDHHVPRAIAAGAQQRGVDVLTAAADGTANRDDEFLLQRAFRHAAGPLRLLQTPDEFRVRRVTPPAEPVARPAMQPECPRPANDTHSAKVTQASTAEAGSPLQLPQR